jgi:hypothetical protein
VWAGGRKRAAAAASLSSAGGAEEERAGRWPAAGKVRRVKGLEASSNEQASHVCLSLTGCGTNSNEL